MIRFFLLSIMMISGAGVSAQVNIYDGCILARAARPDLDFVRINAQKIIRNNKDNCVLTFLDTLTIRAIRNGNKEYFICLESFANASDGYVSEYFMDIGIRLFYKQFKNLFACMYNAHVNKSRNPLEWVMVESVSMQIWDSDNRKEMEKKINAHIDNEIVKGNFNKSQLAYLASVKKKINPEMFD